MTKRSTLFIDALLVAIRFRHLQPGAGIRVATGVDSGMRTISVCVLLLVAFGSSLAQNYSGRLLITNAVFAMGRELGASVLLDGGVYGVVQVKELGTSVDDCLLALARRFDLRFVLISGESGRPVLAAWRDVRHSDGRLVRLRQASFGIPATRRGLLDVSSVKERIEAEDLLRQIGDSAGVTLSFPPMGGQTFRARVRGSNVACVLRGLAEMRGLGMESVRPLNTGIVHEIRLRQVEEKLRSGGGRQAAGQQ